MRIGPDVRLATHQGAQPRLPGIERHHGVAAERLDLEHLRRAARAACPTQGDTLMSSGLQPDLARFGGSSRVGNADRAVGRLDAALAARRFQDVHHRRAEQPRHIDAGRTVIDLDRRADLPDPAVLEDGHAVGDRHRLFLVVRDVDQRLAELALDALQLDTRLLAQPRVERRDRIVHEIGDGIAHQRTGDRHALPLAARKAAPAACAGCGRCEASPRHRRPAGR